MLLNLIKHQQPDIDKIYLYFKDPFESKYESLLKGREKVGIKQTKNQNAFNDYSLTTDDLHENFEDYNPTKKVLIVFDDMIIDMKAHKKSHYYWIVLKREKTRLFTCFLLQYDFKMPKTIRLNATYYFIIKISNKRELEQIASSDLSDTGF